MNKTEQLLSILENYGDILEEADTIDEIILYVSEKISEANKVTYDKGYNYIDDDYFR